MAPTSDGPGLFLLLSVVSRLTKLFLKSWLKHVYLFDTHLGHRCASLWNESARRVSRHQCGHYVI